MRPTCPLTRHVHAFVQLLCDLHGLFRAESELPRGLLLQGAGDEGGGRVAPLLAALDRLDGIRAAFQVCHDLVGRLLVRDLQLLTIPLDQGRIELVLGRVRGECRRHRPVLDGLEGQYLPLPVRDQAHGHRLHTPGGKPWADLFGQNGADLVADDPVQFPTGLLGVYPVHVNGARVQQGGVDRRLGDLVELNPSRVSKAEGFLQVPGDRLAFTVRVRSEIDFAGVLDSSPQFGDNVLSLRDDDVGRREVVLQVNRQLLFREVADVPHARLDLIVCPQKAFERLGLGR